MLEWASGQSYYTADITFHPDTFPFRANVDRTPAWLEQYDNLAPRLTSPILPADRQSVSIVPPHPGPATAGPATAERSSARQRDYQYSAGSALSDIPDIGLPPDVADTFLHDYDNHMVHHYGPDPKKWCDARFRI